MFEIIATLFIIWACCIVLGVVLKLVAIVWGLVASWSDKPYTGPSKATDTIVAMGFLVLILGVIKLYWGH